MSQPCTPPSSPAFELPTAYEFVPNALPGSEASEAFYRYLFECNPQPMWIFDSETLQFLLVNEAAVMHYGYSREEFLAMTIKEIRPAEDVSRLVQRTRASPSVNGKFGVWRHRTKDGQSIEVEVSIHNIRFHGRAGRLALINDITERRRTERTMQHMMEGAHCLLWQAEVSIADPYHLDWDFKLASEQAAQRFLPLEVPPGRTYAEAWHRARLEEDRIRTDLFGDGEIRAGRSYRQEFRCRSRHGDVRWFAEDVRVDPMAEGRWRCTGVCIDVTDQKLAEEGLRRANEELETRVEERTTQLIETNAQLLTAKQEADAANQAKSEFLSRMSHELRTPLNSILGFGQILEKQALTPLQEESLQYMIKGGRHLLNLINEILDIARVEAGHIELSLEPVSVREIVEESCTLVRPMAAERGITLEFGDDSLPRSYIQADRRRLKQALINLLANAVKYNRPGGQVRVSCCPHTDDRLCLAVQDNGPGIAPEDQQRLFTPFERLNAVQSGVEGTGLGLVLTHRLITAMGGHLTLDSLPGEGATFCIELPRAESPEALPADRDAVETVPDGSREPQATVLYIEDNFSNVRLMELLLQSRTGITLLTAPEGAIGLELARSHEPDLILLDLNLPDISGREVFERLKASALTRGIPVIVLSADATAAQIERMQAAGAAAYLTKPLNVPEFLSTLRELLPKQTDVSPCPA